MKRSKLLILTSICMVAILVLSFMSACAKPAAAPAGKITLQFSTYQSPTTTNAKYNMQPVFDEWARRSNGNVEVVTHYGGVLYKQPAEEFDAISTGKVDMVWFPTANNAAFGPIWGLAMVPLLFDSYDHFWRAWQAGVGDIFISEAAKKNIIFVGKVPVYSGVNYMWSNKSVPRAPADIKGLKTRVFSDLLTEMVKQAGGAPVVMQPSDVYLAMQKGTIDAYITNTTGGFDAYKLYEVTKYGFTVPILATGSIGFLAVNKSVWERLPKDVQDMMVSSTEVIQWNYNQMILREEDARLLKKFKDYGMKIDAATPQDIAAWGQLTGPVEAKFLENTGDEGKKALDIVEKTR